MTRLCNIDSQPELSFYVYVIDITYSLMTKPLGNPDVLSPTTSSPVFECL